jgi:uncharacterized membrane protein YfcA
MTLLLACSAAFLAGFVDAVAGGGGLIQLPALLAAYPEAPVPELLGTNKVASFAGTSSALWRYARAVAVPWRAAGPAAATALVGSYTGARLAGYMPSAWMRPVVIVLLAAVAVYTMRRKDLGDAPTEPRIAGWAGGALIGGALGLYDGFFGPGTGTFLLVAFVTLQGLDFLSANAGAKLVNVATNLAAIAAFASAGQVRWELALPMAACNVAGAQLGSRLALRSGAPFVRRVLLVVVTALLVKLTWDALHA